MNGQLSDAKLRQLEAARQKAVESRRRRLLVRLQRDVEVTKLKLAVEQKEGAVQTQREALATLCTSLRADMTAS